MAKQLGQLFYNFGIDDATKKPLQLLARVFTIQSVGYIGIPKLGTLRFRHLEGRRVELFIDQIFVDHKPCPFRLVWQIVHQI